MGNTCACMKPASSRHRRKSATEGRRAADSSESEREVRVGSQPFREAAQRNVSVRRRERAAAFEVMYCSDDQSDVAAYPACATTAVVIERRDNSVDSAPLPIIVRDGSPVSSSSGASAEHSEAGGNLQHRHHDESSLLSAGVAPEGRFMHSREHSFVSSASSDGTCDETCDFAHPGAVHPERVTSGSAWSRRSLTEDGMYEMQLRKSSASTLKRGNSLTATTRHRSLRAGAWGGAGGSSRCSSPVVSTTNTSELGGWRAASSSHLTPGLTSASIGDGTTLNRSDNETWTAGTLQTQSSSVLVSIDDANSASSGLSRLTGVASLGDVATTSQPPLAAVAIANQGQSDTAGQPSSYSLPADLQRRSRQLDIAEFQSKFVSFVVVGPDELDAIERYAAMTLPQSYATMARRAPPGSPPLPAAFLHPSVAAAPAPAPAPSQREVSEDRLASSLINPNDPAATTTLVPLLQTDAGPGAALIEVKLPTDILPMTNFTPHFAGLNSSFSSSMPLAPLPAAAMSHSSPIAGEPSGATDSANRSLPALPLAVESTAVFAERSRGLTLCDSSASHPSMAASVVSPQLRSILAPSGKYGGARLFAPTSQSASPTGLSSSSATRQIGGGGGQFVRQRLSLMDSGDTPSSPSDASPALRPAPAMPPLPPPPQSTSMPPATGHQGRLVASSSLTLSSVTLPRGAYMDGSSTAPTSPATAQAGGANATSSAAARYTVDIHRSPEPIGMLLFDKSEGRTTHRSYQAIAFKEKVQKMTLMEAQAFHDKREEQRLRHMRAQRLYDMEKAQLQREEASMGGRGRESGTDDSEDSSSDERVDRDAPPGAAAYLLRERKRGGAATAKARRVLDTPELSKDDTASITGLPGDLDDEAPELLGQVE